MQVFMGLSILILLVIQRVAPMPRVWIYLEVFYMLFAAAGLAWLTDLFIQKFVKTKAAEKIVPAMILLAVIMVFTSKYMSMQNESVIANRNILPEQHAADYLTSHLKAEDTILSVAPVDIRTAYYLYMNGVSYDVFYQRDHPVKIHNAVVILRTTSKYNTPESVLDFYSLTPEFNLEATQLVFEYGQLSVYSIPAK